MLEELHSNARRVEKHLTTPGFEPLTFRFPNQKHCLLDYQSNLDAMLQPILY